jgi:hypothetical protein
MTFFTELLKTIIKFMWIHRRPQIAKAILNKERKSRGISRTNFANFTAIVTKLCGTGAKTDK